MRSRRIPRYLAGLALVFCLVWPAAPTRAGLTGDQVSRIQAAFLVRFCRYVEWPQNAFAKEQAPIIIGILGHDPFGSAINQTARNFRAQGHDIKIVRLLDRSDARKCHILFVAPDQEKHLPEIEASIKDLPVLLVSNMDHFLEEGGMIQFIIQNSKIRFDIDLADCRRHNLKISSKLLKIAHQVVR